MKSDHQQHAPEDLSNDVYYGKNWQPQPNRWSYDISYSTDKIANSFQWVLSRLHRTKYRRDTPLFIAQALPPALKMACQTICRAQFSTYCRVEISIWTAFWCWINIMHPFDRRTTNKRVTAWFYVDSAIAKIGKLGAANFSNFDNDRIDVKSGCSSLVGCARITWVHTLDSVSKGGSDGYLNLVIGRELRSAGRLTRHFEGRRQCLSDDKWRFLSILCPMKSRQHSLERARKFQFFMSRNWCHMINGSAVVADFVP